MNGKPYDKCPEPVRSTGWGREPVKPRRQQRSELKVFRRLRNDRLFTCVVCGGDVFGRRGSGRMFEYERGISIEIPPSIVVPTCHECGEMYLSEELLDEVDRRLERQGKGTMKRKKPMSEAQKAALAKGREKRLSSHQPNNQPNNHEQVGKETPAPSSGHRAQAQFPKIQDTPKETEQRSRVLSADTVVMPVMPHSTPPKEPELDEEAEARVIAHQRLYESEEWQVVVDGKIDTTSTADECWVRAAKARKEGSTVVVADPNGVQLPDAEAEEKAKRWAKQARNWQVEHQNGGLQSVLFRGKMDDAVNAFERHKRNVRGASLVLYNGTGEPVRQVNRPQFRTTINGPENEIEVDDQTYKKYVGPRPESTESSGSQGAQSLENKTGVESVLDQIEACWDGKRWHNEWQKAKPQQDFGGLPANFDEVVRLMKPTEKLKNITEAIAITRALLVFLEGRREEIQREFVTHLQSSNVRDFAIGSLLDNIRKL